MFSFEMIWRTTQLLHGEGGEAAIFVKAQVQQILQFKTRHLINLAPFSRVLSPIHNAQVLKMHSSTSSTIQHLGLEYSPVLNIFFKKSGLFSSAMCSNPKMFRIKNRAGTYSSGIKLSDFL